MSNFCHEELISGKYPEVIEYLNKEKLTKKKLFFLKLDMLHQKIIFMKN